MATKIKQVSLPKKVKAMRAMEVVSIKPDEIRDILPVLNTLSFPIHREYQQGYLIITRTA